MEKAPTKPETNKQKNKNKISSLKKIKNQNKKRKPQHQQQKQATHCLRALPIKANQQQMVQWSSPHIMNSKFNVTPGKHSSKFGAQWKLLHWVSSPS